MKIIKSSYHDLFKQVGRNFDDTAYLAGHHPFGKSKAYCKRLDKTKQTLTSLAIKARQDGNDPVIKISTDLLSMIPAMTYRDKARKVFSRIIVPLNRQEDMCRTQDALVKLRKVLVKQGVNLGRKEIVNEQRNH